MGDVVLGVSLGSFVEFLYVIAAQVRYRSCLPLSGMTKLTPYKLNLMTLIARVLLRRNNKMMENLSNSFV